MPEIAADQTRIEWIDAAKGIGIIGVIAVHSIIPTVNVITATISSYAIPLFFIMAGLTYRADRHRYDLKRFAVSRGKQFLIPYFCLQTILMALFYILPNIVDTNLTPNEVVFWFFYGSGPPLQSTHLWFLPVLYFGFLLFAGIDRILVEAPRFVRIFMIPVLALLGQLTISMFSPQLVPWHIGAILIACAFTVIGNELRKEGGLYAWKTKSMVQDLLVLLMAFTAMFLLSELNGFTDIAVDNIGVSVLIYLGAGTLGTLVIFILASYLVDMSTSIRDKLVFLGNASQEIYEFHPIAFFLAVPFMMSLGWLFPEIIFPSETLWVLRFTMGLLVTVPVVIYMIRQSWVLTFMFTGRRRRLRERTIKDSKRVEPPLQEIPLDGQG